VPFQFFRGSDRSRDDKGDLLSASRMVLQGARVPRLGVLLVTLVLAGAFVGVGHAADVVVPEDVSATTSDAVADEAPPADTSLDTSTESPPPDPSTDPTAESPPPDPSSDPTAESPPPDPSTDPTAESPPPDPSTDPTAESPPPDPSTEPTAESPPPDASTEPPPESPPADTTAAPGTSAEDGAPSPPEGSSIGLGLGSSVALSVPLPGIREAFLVPSGKGGSASGQTSTRAGASAKSGKAQDVLRGIFMPGQSPASSPSSGGSSGSAPSSSGAGFALAVEFLLPLLAMLCCAFGLSFALPHSSAFALRSERPG
jgi:outer membrane biosynthesis protein TonB